MATLTTLVSFNGTDGSNPEGGVIADANGDLFGTTSLGGASGASRDGTVFEYSPGSAGGSLTTVSFNGVDGETPSGNLVLDANGDVLGTTSTGGTIDSATSNYGDEGTVFELAKTASGFASTPTALVSFNGSDGGKPEAGLITDASGNLFGTAGDVVEVAKTATGYASTPTVLASSNGLNGTIPDSLIVDANGDLFGTTMTGGAGGDGTVFEIAKTATGYASTVTVLASFNGSDGTFANSLIVDANGDLFGTTLFGGAYAVSAYNAGGTVFEIAKTATGYASTPTVLASFDEYDGAGPSSLILDANGDLFGTAGEGGPGADAYGGGEGVVFEIANTATGYASTPTVVVAFNGAVYTTQGVEPDGSLIADANGDLFGTTQQGGTSNDGTLFEITDSGFVVPCFCRGTRILTARGEVAVEDLRVGDLAVTFLGRGEVLKPVRWLGHRRIDLARHPRAQAVRPVRIRAGALAESRPHRDLLVSPGHRFPLDGVLVAALDLVNGASIVQEAPDAVEYWHVELDAHDVLLAEGAEAESYQDTGNRDGFESGTVVALRPPSAAALDLDGAAPEPCLPYGVPGAALRARLRARAEALGWTLSKDPAPWLEAAGVRIEPQRRGDRYRFALPPGCAEARLRSRAVRPRDIGMDDERRLGLQLHRLDLVTAAGAQSVALDHPSLAEGFSRLEREEGWTWRWTDGDATLPLAALAAGQAVTALEVAVEPGLRFWAAPADAALGERHPAEAHATSASRSSLRRIASANPA